MHSSGRLSIVAAWVLIKVRLTDESVVMKALLLD